MTKPRLRIKGPLLALLALPLFPGAAYGALAESVSNIVSGTGQQAVLYEDTSAANAQLVLTTSAKDYSRSLRSVSVVCSGSTTVTVTNSITRAKVVSGSVIVSLPDVAITATTSGAMYLDVLLAAADVVVVTVPAAGVGVTCTAQVLEIKR